MGSDLELFWHSTILKSLGPLPIILHCILFFSRNLIQLFRPKCLYEVSIALDLLPLAIKL